MDRNPLKLVFSIDYHLALLRARAGHDGYKAWGERRVQPPTELDALPLEEATALLVPLATESRYRRHAAGSCAMAIATAARSGQQWAAETVRRWFDASVRLGLVPADALAPLGNDFNLLTPMEAYMAVAFSASSCSITTPVPTFTFDVFEVTTVSIEFVVDRPLDAYLKRFDPRMWDVGAAESFAEADRILEAERTLPIPGSIDFPPPPTLPDELLESEEAGTPWNGPLYENAVTAVSGTRLTDFRNILTIDYQVDPKVNPLHIHLHYWLSESLTMQMAGSDPFPAGLDRDSGEAFLERRGSSTFVRASKSVRITQPPERRDVLNHNMAAAMQFWFNCLVLLAVCENL